MRCNLILIHQHTHITDTFCSGWGIDDILNAWQEWIYKNSNTPAFHKIKFEYWTWPHTKRSHLSGDTHTKTSCQSGKTSVPKAILLCSMIIKQKKQRFLPGKIHKKLCTCRSVFTMFIYTHKRIESLFNLRDVTNKTATRFVSNRSKKGF